MKALAILPAALALASATTPGLPASAFDPPTIGDNIPSIAKVRCIAGSGSAVRIGPSLWLSVAHVTDIGGCTVGGIPVEMVWTAPGQDFSIFRLPAQSGEALKIDCGGFRAGGDYVAIGHARGLERQTRVHLTATAGHLNGMAVLIGMFTVIPGQSGGGILDENTGKLVGMVNTFNMPKGYSGSVELKATPLCAA